jgi:hypothetical protein
MVENSKLIHFTNLSGEDMYFLVIKTDSGIRQQEINHHEFMELKRAENDHYNTEIIKLKEKYRLIDEERVGL